MSDPAISERPRRPSATGSVTFVELFHAVVDNVERVLHGKRAVVELALSCLLAEGHLLIDDVPGVGKTLLAKALAASVDAEWRRIQFTPDLLPGDVLGTVIYDRHSGEFEFKAGPVFTNFLLCDEINRASPKAQSALLEAMEERQVSADGQTYSLPAPFLVLATQNPTEHVGTQPLPDSQLDRFLVRTSLGYPDRASEIAVLDTHSSSVGPQRDPTRQLQVVASTEDLLAMVDAARTVHVASPLKAYVVDLLASTRAHPAVRLGGSPRAGLALVRMARVRAAVAGREYALPDDVQAAAAPVLEHRLQMSDESMVRGIGAGEVVADVLARVPVPQARRR